MDTVTTSNKTSRFQSKLRRQIEMVLRGEGIAQNVFADRAGVSTVTLNRFLRGHSSLSADALERCATAAGCRVDLVLPDSEENPAETT
jgi:transcriptional regulator with XRE-family HTH domain